MNEEIFRFIDCEIAASNADPARLKHLRAVRSYLLAARKLRASFELRDYKGVYLDIPRAADEFDLACAMVLL